MIHSVALLIGEDDGLCVMDSSCLPGFSFFNAVKSLKRGIESSKYNEEDP